LASPSHSASALPYRNSRKPLASSWSPSPPVELFKGADHVRHPVRVLREQRLTQFSDLVHLAPRISARDPSDQTLLRQVLQCAVKRPRSQPDLTITRLFHPGHDEVSVRRLNQAHEYVIDRFRQR